MKYEVPKMKLIFSAEEALALANFESIRDEIEDYNIDSIDVTNAISYLVKSKNSRVEYADFIVEIKD